MEYMELSEKYSRICEENRKLAKENAKLISIIEKLKTDRSYIEKIAREKYNMIKRDEILIKIEKKGGGK
jgi:cell division protein FtsB